MRILISSYGSRGDVQPMVALGAALRALKVEVLMCAPPDKEFVELLERNQIPMVPALASVQQWIEQARKTGMKLPQLSQIMVAGQFDILNEAAEGCCAIIATGLFPSRAAAQLVSERRGIEFVSVHFCPQYLPSPDIPPLEFPGWPHPKGLTDCESLWELNIQVMNSLFGEAVNAHRIRLGLKPVENVREQAFTRRPWLVSDAVLGPWRASDLCQGVQTGAWMLSDSRALPADLIAFLESGAAPVYCGFGSMAMQAAPDAARVAIEANRAHGRRTILAQCLAGLVAIDDCDDCFVLGEVNHQALFPRVAAVIHHGGAGTTTTAAQAGVPQVIVPQVADQPYWAHQLVRLGIGAAHAGPVPNVASLTTALGVALAPQTTERANAMAPEICTDGAITSAKMLVSEIGV